MCWYSTVLITVEIVFDRMSLCLHNNDTVWTVWTVCTVWTVFLPTLCCRCFQHVLSLDCMTVCTVCLSALLLPKTGFLYAATLSEPQWVIPHPHLRTRIISLLQTVSRVLRNVDEQGSYNPRWVFHEPLSITVATCTTPLAAVLLSSWEGDFSHLVFFCLRVQSWQNGDDFNRR